MRQDLSELKAQMRDMTELIQDVRASVIKPGFSQLSQRSSLRKQRTQLSQELCPSVANKKNDNPNAHVDGAIPSPLVSSSPHGSCSKDASTMEPEDNSKAIEIEAIHLESAEWEPLANSMPMMQLLANTVPRIHMESEPTLSSPPSRRKLAVPAVHRKLNPNPEGKCDEPCRMCKSNG